MFAQMQNRAMLEFALKQAIWQLKSQYPKSLTLGKLFPETLVATRDACSPRITPAMTVAGLMINCDEDGVGYGPELSAMFPETKTYNQVAMGYGTPIYLFWAVLSVILNDPSGSAEDFAAAKLRKVPQYAHLADEAQQYLDELVRQGLGYLISSFNEMTVLPPETTCSGSSTILPVPARFLPRSGSALSSRAILWGFTLRLFSRFIPTPGREKEAVGDKEILGFKTTETAGHTGKRRDSRINWSVKYKFANTPFVSSASFAESKEDTQWELEFGPPSVR